MAQVLLQLDSSAHREIMANEFRPALTACRRDGPGKRHDVQSTGRTYTNVVIGSQQGRWLDQSCFSAAVATVQTSTTRTSEAPSSIPSTLGLTLVSQPGISEYAWACLGTALGRAERHWDDR